MSALAIPDMNELPVQRPPQQGDEATHDDPSNASPKEQQPTGRPQLDERAKKLLKEVRTKYKQKWAFIRRAKIRNASRNFEYLKDNQYIIWDPYQARFYNPFEDSLDGTNQNKDDSDVYTYVNNVMQWAERVWESTLGAALPKARFYPDDADKDADIESAEEASKVQKKIERQNRADSLINQELLYLFAAGNYFRYSRWVRDSDKAGVSREPVWALQEQELKPDRYVCPQCATETPAQGPASQCPNCGYQMGEEDFHEALMGEVPTVVDYEEVPNGQLCWSLYNTLHIDMAPYPTDDSVDPLTQTPILDLENEVDVAAARASYPEAYNVLNSGATAGSGQTDGDFARIARQRVFSPSLGRGQVLTDIMPTMSRCWIRDWAFYILDKKEDADYLKGLFPNGCKLVSFGDTVLDAVPEKLTNYWSWCGTRKGYGAYPPAIADPGIPFQDRINDTGNNIHRYMDSLASPDVLANANLIDVEAWNGTSMSGGGLKPVYPKKSLGPAGDISKAFFQPDFHIDSKIFQYQQDLIQMFQLLLGVMPQTYGGHQQGIDTFGGQKQALDVATGVLAVYWKFISEEHANAARISVKNFAKNALDDDRDVVPDENDIEGTKFRNEVIYLDRLQGEFHSHPDVDQGLPESAMEMRQRLEEIINQGAKNPLVQSLFDVIKNRRVFAKNLLPEGITIPGLSAFKKVMEDITKLLQDGETGAGPLPPDPMTGMQLPSVLPDKLIDDLDISLQTCKEWAQENYYKVASSNPAGWQNFLLYLKIVAQFSEEEKMAMMPPPSAPQGQPQPAGAA